MHLTRRSYFFAALIVLLGIAGLWSNAQQEHLWRYPAALAIVALLIEWLLARRRSLRMEYRPRGAMRLGRQHSASLVLHNEGLLTLCAESEQAHPEALFAPVQRLEWRIPAGGEAVRTLSVLPQQLGKFNWGKNYLRVLGYFGLAWWSRALAVPGEIDVVPDRLDEQGRTTGTVQQGDIHRPSVGTGGDLLSLREYQPGDSLRMMDWKATARSGRHIVRLFTQEQHLDIVLLIDAGRNSILQSDTLTRLGHYANIAARLAEKAMGNADRVGLVVFADRPLAVVPPGKGHAHLLKLREALARMRSQACEADPLQAVMRVLRLVQQRSLVVLFTDLYEADGASQLARAMNLLLPKHMPLIVGIVDEDIQLIARQPAREWLDPYDTLAAQEGLTALRLAKLRLQRSGAHVVVSSAKRMDSAVLRYYEELRNKKRIGF